MHPTRAIPRIALTLLARPRKCHTVRTFGLTAVTKAREEKDDESKEKKGEEQEDEDDDEGVVEEVRGGVVSGRYAKNLKLSRGWREEKRGGRTAGGGYGKPKAPRRTI